MNQVEVNKNMHLSEHFTLGEVTKTSVKTADGRSATQGDALLAKNIPSREHIENLRNLCEGWLEELRENYNMIYEGVGDCKGDEPIIINSGYRSPEVNKSVGGSPTSNHLTGCAVDIMGSAGC